VAAPPKYPFGTDLIVPGYGRAEVQDRGGAIRAAGQMVNGRRLRYDRIDLLMPTHRQALRFGRVRLTVLVRGR
jgi:3D (Asp-Asp-Asp) domain-containing protein